MKKSEDMPKSFRLPEGACRILEAGAAKLEVSQATILKIALREWAERNLP